MNDAQIGIIIVFGTIVVVVLALYLFGLLDGME